MNAMTSTALRARGFARQRGFTLIELMVGLTIGLVVVLGFTGSFVSMKTAFVSQDRMSQLQDNERLSLAILTASVQEAGFFTDPVTYTSQSSPLLGPMTSATYGNLLQGQPVMGTVAAGSQPETLSTRYGAGKTDSLLNCVGGPVSTATADGYVRNVFFVSAATNTLGCVYTIDGTNWVTDTGGRPFALVSNVASMSVLYGVDTDGNGAIDSYLSASSLSAAQWVANVRAVRVTLNFLNPNAAQTGQPATIPWVQTINLMNNK